MNNNDNVMSKSESKPEPAPAPAPAQGGPAMAPRPWDVEVDIYLTKGCPDPEFEIRTTLPIDPATGNIIFQNNRRPGFNIKFNLFDETGSGYVFPSQPQVQQACWSQLGTSCPQTSVWQVFDPRRVSNHGQTLEVYNQNPSQSGGNGLGPFKYTLRVTNDGGATYCDLDPGGDDQNGPDR